VTSKGVTDIQEGQRVIHNGNTDPHTTCAGWDWWMAGSEVVGKTLCSVFGHHAPW
jgi:hypothetical protein